MKGDCITLLDTRCQEISENDESQEKIAKILKLYNLTFTIAEYLAPGCVQCDGLGLGEILKEDTNQTQFG